MPVMRPRTAATGGAAAAARPLPPPGKISAHAFRVEKKGQYQGGMNVPTILFIGRPGEAADQSEAKQKKAELSKYKLRPGALEELGIEEGDDEKEDLDVSGVRAGGGTRSPERKSVSYDMAPYGGKREMDSLRKQIIETETAALDSRLQSQMVVSKTQNTVSMVEEKVGHVRESNQQLDSELVEIEKQIEELKRISSSQIDEIKSLRDTNKHKETKLHSEQQQLQRMEGSVRDSMLIKKEDQQKQHKDKEQGGALGHGPGAAASGDARKGRGAGGSSGTGASSGAGASGGGGTGTPGASAGVTAAQDLGGDEGVYKGDTGEKPTDHAEIQDLLQLCDNVEDVDGRIWGQAAHRRAEEQQFIALHASEDYIEVPPWLAASKPPSDWSRDKGSRKLSFQVANTDEPHADMQIEHVHGYAGSSSVDAVTCTGSGKVIYPAASLCVVHDLVHGRQRFFNGHSDGVLCLAMHPEGRLVASGDVGKSSKVLVWDAETPEQPATTSLWGFHQSGIATLAFSRDGNKLVTVSLPVPLVICLCLYSHVALPVITRAFATLCLSVSPCVSLYLSVPLCASLCLSSQVALPFLKSTAAAPLVLLKVTPTSAPALYIQVFACATRYLSLPLLTCRFAFHYSAYKSFLYIQVDRKNPPPGMVFYLLCSRIKSRVY